MALSSHPPPWLPNHLFPTPSRRPLFSLFNSFPSYPSTSSNRILKFKVISSSIDSHKRKNSSSKRKLRPSFYEQIKDKWSLKIDSPRQHFPWQNQEDLKTDPVQLVSSEVAADPASDSATDSESFDVPNSVKIAPWDHGASIKKTQIVFYSEEKRNGQIVQISSGLVSDSVCIPVQNRVPSLGRGTEIRKGQNEISGNGKRVENFDNAASGVGRKLETFDDISIAANDSSKHQNVDTKEVIEGGKIVNDGNSIDSLREKDYDKWFREVRDSGLENKPVDLPWRKERNLESMAKWQRSNTELAEKLVPEHELKRLKNVALRMVERTKVGAAGVTQELVDSIHEKWKNDEVVKLKFEGPAAFNMKRTHDVLESRAGGLVIWRSGSSIVLYRGLAYKLPCVQMFQKENIYKNADVHEIGSDSLQTDQLVASVHTRESYIPRFAECRKELSNEELMELNELDSLLEALGPRFKDWSGREPFPVDADLLPPVVPGFKTPIRLLPFGARQNLTNREMTDLRRLARRMPPHFALGRSKELQGLAKATVKLWEKSAIVKIAIKRGVLNTLNEKMAEELKTLTGGTLVSRNKEYIVFYRGHDFLPPAITDTLKEREKLTESRQDEEEKARKGTPALVVSSAKTMNGSLVAGTLAETIAATSRWANQPSSGDIEKMRKDLAVAKHASLVRYLEKKLVLAKQKIRKAEKALMKVQECLEPADLPSDLETITDEERFLFRKIGLSMKPFLLLGRRGVFDGTVENMHLHWKFREVVKIIVRGKNFAQVKHVAISLEAESGGVLVSLDKTTKGYAIIVYRGKNYQRPYAMRPMNLLTRRQALSRSIELQRREALKHHILDLEEQIELLKSGLEEMSLGKEIDEKTLHSRLSKSHALYDDTEEDDGEEAYLEVYTSDGDDSDIQN